MGGSDSDHLPPHQGHLLFQRLLGLKSRRVKLKIASSLNDCAELKALAAHGEPLCHIFNLQWDVGGGKPNQKQSVTLPWSDKLRCIVENMSPASCFSSAPRHSDVQGFFLSYFSTLVQPIKQLHFPGFVL